MLDQNITIILSTLLGGVLTIVGGFIANHYTQSTAKRAERWKELRNITEALYKASHQIKSLYHHIIINYPTEEPDHFSKEFAEIGINIDKINMLVDLYVPPLQRDFTKFLLEIEELNKRIELIPHTPLKSNQSTHKFTKYEEQEKALKFLRVIHTNFHEAIIKLIKQKGYSYF